MDDIVPNISEKELHKHEKHLDLKRDSPVISSHGDEILKTKESLSTSTSDQTLGPDALTEPAGEALPWVSKERSCLNSKCISSLIQDTGANSNSFQSRNSSPVKSSNSRSSCPPKNRTGSKDATTLQNHEDDQDEATGINKPLTGSFQVYDEVVQKSVIAVPQRHTESSW